MIADVSQGRDNNFNLLRMLAATAVLISHSWPLALGNGAIEPLETETGYKLGTTAVSVFFAISGFFITKSFDRRISLGDFALARFARIYPALIVILLLTVFLLGPSMTAWPLSAYFIDHHTWTYAPKNLLLWHPQWSLPGVFTHNPGGSAINGSLWTLFFEVCCYAGVVALGLLNIVRIRYFIIAPMLTVMLIFLVPQSETGNGFLGLTSILTLPFALGASAYVYRAYVPVSALIAGVLIVIAIITRGTILYPLTHALAVSYGALWFGFSLPQLRGYNVFGDYSYGMYIYAFPCQQIAAALIPMPTPLLLIALSLPPTLILAFVSWTFIESPALAHRHLLRRVRFSRRPAAAKIDSSESAPLGTE